MSLTALRRCVGAVAALLAAATTLSVATTPAHAAPGSCSVDVSVTTLRPGETVIVTVTGDLPPSYIYALTHDGAVPPGYTGGGASNPLVMHLSHSYYLGASVGGFRIYADYPESPTDPGLCEGTFAIGDAVVPPTAQTIDFTTHASHDLTWFATPATATSGLEVQFTSLTPDVCEVGTYGGVTPLKAGTCTIAADQEGDEEYAAAPRVTRDITITPYDQTVVFAPIDDQILGSEPVRLYASSTMDLQVDLTSQTPSVCTISGRYAVLAAVGTCTILADQPGAPGTITPASATRSFQVLPVPVPPAPKPPTTTPQAPLPRAVLRLKAPAGAPLSAGTVAVKASSTGTGAIALVSRNADVCKVTGSGVRLLAAGQCRLRATQSADSGHLAPQAVTASFPVWGAPTVPAKARTTEVLRVLGKGEDRYRVTASPAGVCRVTDGAVALVDGGTCRITVRSGGKVVRSARVEVVVPARPAATANTMDLGVTVYFRFNSAQLTRESRAALRGVARKLRSADLVVAYGHTYGPGKNSQRSRNLAARRAEAVVGLLDDLGVKSKAVTEVAMAMQQPVSNVAWKNRRVEVYFR